MLVDATTRFRSVARSILQGGGDNRKTNIITDFTLFLQINYVLNHRHNQLTFELSLVDIFFLPMHESIRKSLFFDENNSGRGQQSDLGEAIPPFATPSPWLWACQDYAPNDAHVSFVILYCRITTFVYRYRIVPKNNIGTVPKT